MIIKADAEPNVFVFATCTLSFFFTCAIRQMLLHQELKGWVYITIFPGEAISCIPLQINYFPLLHSLGGQNTMYNYFSWLIKF